MKGIKFQKKCKKYAENKNLDAFFWKKLSKTVEKICLFVLIIVLLGCKPETNKTKVTNQINDELAFEEENKDFQSNRKKVKLYFWDKEKDTFRLTSYCLGWLYKPNDKEKNGKWNIKWNVFTANKSVILSPEYTTEAYPYYDSNLNKEKIKSQNYKLSLMLTIPNGIGTQSLSCDYYIFEYFNSERKMDRWDIRPVIDTVPIEFWGERENGKLFRAQLIIE